MPSLEFAKNIASIFSHNDIKEELKYDIICRLICNSFDALNVSILIYDSSLDKLTCRGSYISSKYYKWNANPEISEYLIGNMPILEFFENTPLAGVERLSLLDFNTFQEIIDSNKINITNETFDFLRNSWIEKGVNKKYEKYKKLLRSESHSVNGSSFTGKYFQELLEKKTQLTSEIKVEEISYRHKYSKKYFTLLDKIGIECKAKDLIYLGSPLFATERYSGILRIIIDEDYGEKNEIIDGGKSLKLIEKYHERLISFSQIISLHLKTNFYLTCFRAISKLKVDLNENLTIDSNELDNVCSEVSNVLNCNGALIRIKEDPKATDSPVIRGISSSLCGYKEYVEAKASSSFSKDIMRVFANEKHNRSKIQAIVFSLLKCYNDVFETNEYFYSKTTGRLRNKTVPERRFNDFTAEYKRKLIGLKIVEIAVVPLYNFENSFIVYTNTQNRKFTASDIEIMLLASQRIGLEIKHTQDTKRRNEIELNEGIEGSVRIIEHQVGQMVKSSHDCIEQILHKNEIIRKRGFKKELVDWDDLEHIIEKLKLLRFLIKQAKSQILKRAGVERLEKKQRNINADTIEDLWKFLKNKCIDFEPYAYLERGIHVWLTNPEERNVRLYTDSELLSEVLNNLIDNAIKYSFDGSEMRKKNIRHDEYNYHSEGNILISYESDYSKMRIYVTNWGPPILLNERPKIYEKNFRGSNATLALGSGLGLYYVNSIIQLLHGKIDVNIDKNKITFLIELNR